MVFLSLSLMKVIKVCEGSRAPLTKMNTLGHLGKALWAIFATS